MIGFDIPLLFVLAVRFVEQFNLKTSVYLYVLPDRQLVFWIVTFILLAAYVLVRMQDAQEKFRIIRLTIVGVLGVFLIGSLFAIQIAARQATDPILYTHDGAVQTEDAIAALRSGENPYALDYRTRTFGAYPDVFSEATRPNPAWDHYIYMPLQIILGLPIAVLFEAVAGWFDIRLLYILSFVLLVVCGTRLVRDHERQILTLIFLLFNPLFTQFFVAGFNDIFFLGWIALGALLLQRKRLVLAAIAIGLAVASKQSAWFLLPFFFTHLWCISNQDWRLSLRRLLPTVVTALLIILPFFLWSPSDFYEDTIRYATGSATYSYPISGFGLGQLLLSMGVIASMWDQYPFWIFQMVVGIPLFVWLFRWQRRDANVGRMLAAYGVFTLFIWLTSRYFNDSYIGVIAVILTLSYAATPGKQHTS